MTSGPARIVERLEDVELPHGRAVALTIGTFDGVHRAHQSLLAETVARARAHGGLAVALTFRNHPRGIVAPERLPRLLTPWEHKRELLLAQGVDLVVGLEFDEDFSRMSAEAFIRDVITGRFRARVVLSGPGFHFGHGGRGNAALLQTLSGEFDYQYICREPVVFAGEKVSSTRIRRLLEAGEVSLARELLARPHRNAGIVVRGDRIGRTIGFPTANLEISPDSLVPLDGVYAVRVTFGGHAPWPAMMNIGTRPTVRGQEHRKEVHIIGFDDDLEGLELRVEYIARLRDERKFDGLNELKAQLARDREAALEAIADYRAASE